MLANDQKNTVLCELSQDGRNEAVYSAYGHRANEAVLNGHLGYNGERREVQTGCYLLGNGHRAFSPLLMRFHSPDSWSPFGDGGLNSYSYTMGDPINYTDPSGHFKWAVLMGMLMNGGDDVMRSTSRTIGSSSRSVSGLASRAPSNVPVGSPANDLLSGYTIYTGAPVVPPRGPTLAVSRLPGSAGPNGAPGRSSHGASFATPGLSRGAVSKPRVTFAPEKSVAPRVKEAPMAQPVPKVPKAPRQVDTKEYNKMSVFQREAYHKAGGIEPTGGKLHRAPKKTALDIRGPDRDRFGYK
jgi:RHS repeat-associated protein